MNMASKNSFKDMISKRGLYSKDDTGPTTGNDVANSSRDQDDIVSSSTPLMNPSKSKTPRDKNIPNKSESSHSNSNKTNDDHDYLIRTHRPSTTSDSSEHLLQSNRSTNSNLAFENRSPSSNSNIAQCAKDHRDQERNVNPPESLEMKSGQSPPAYSSLKNWVRLASFEKSDLSQKSPSSNDSNSVSINVELDGNDKTPDNPDEKQQEKDSRLGGKLAVESPSKTSFPWGKTKNNLNLPGLRKDGGASSQTFDLTPGQKFLSAAMAVHATVRLSRIERAKRRAKWAGKKFLVFLLSHIGLILVLLLYATAGGFLFRWLEGGAEVQSKKEAGNVRLLKSTVEIQRKKDLHELRDEYLLQMWNETINLNVFHPDTWSQSMGAILEEFEQKVFDSVSLVEKWDVVEEEEEDPWTIPASLLFSTTVITSIGYGDITPKTTAGKLVCIPFAIVGIPLTLICLANIGQLMAGCFRFIWRRVLQCARCCRPSKDPLGQEPDCKPGKTRVPITVCLCIVIGYTLLGALIFSSWENDWSFLDGFYFSFITLSTIGFGDFVPGQYEKGSNERRVVCALYLLIGLATLSMVFQLMIDSVMEVVEKFAKLFGLSKEQIKEEIEGIDECSVQTQNLIAPPGVTEAPKVTVATDVKTT